MLTVITVVNYSAIIINYYTNYYTTVPHPLFTRVSYHSYTEDVVRVLIYWKVLIITAKQSGLKTLILRIDCTTPRPTGV